MERLDNEITMIVADTENELPEYPRFWWSDTLHNAYLVKEYWKAALSFEQNNTDDALILDQRHKTMVLTHQWTYSKEIKQENNSTTEESQKESNNVLE
eukprot:8576689-Ditylum_brightwellii.AAC.1